MKTAYFDCFAGISGDMILGALIDCGLDFHDLEIELKKLNITGYEINIKKVIKNGIAGTKFNITCIQPQAARHLSEIEKIITGSTLDNKIIDKSIQIFKKIAEVESKIHGVGVQDVHFHEIGALDSIIDIVGSIIAIQKLGINKIFSSKINLGSGYVNTMHGKLPVPAPATLELLKNIPVYSSGALAELTTPTGAALISSIAENFGDFPDMKIISTGYGAGTRDLEIPNLLRIVLGKITISELDTDSVLVLETNIDDMNPEFYRYIYDKLLNAGALDVFSSQILMKKSRPAILLSIISNHSDADKLIDIIFSETTSSGIRSSNVTRKKLNKSSKTLTTKYGEIRIKIHKKGKTIITLSPEYDDCEEIAQKTGIPLKDIYDEAKNTALNDKFFKNS